ncbi:MAG TPA: thiamine pyrophosphate-binding protein [Gaiellaceae bacterium]
MTETQTGATSLVRQLERYGVEFVFGICGHTNIAVLNALEPSSITFLTGRHEQVAAHAADGYARMSGKPGVVLLHTGPGLTNATTGVATAALDSVPMVVIAGDVPSYYHGRHPHQEINLHADAEQGAIFSPFVKRVWNVGRVEDLPRFLERAFWTATSGRPGPVLLNVPMDMFSRPVGDNVDSEYPLPEDVAKPGLGSGVAEAIVGELAGAARPLIYVGGGVRSDAARRALIGLAEHFDLPIAHSLMGKGCVPDNHPLVVGMLGFWGTEYSNDSARKADLVLALGTRFAETDASSWDPRYGLQIPPTRLIQIDIDAAEIGRNYPVALGAVANLDEALPELFETAKSLGIDRVEQPGLRSAIAEARDAVWTRMQERGSRDDFPLAPERILEDLRAELPPESVLVTDVGWNKNGVAQAYLLPEAGRFITPGGFSTMGYGPAAAIGVKLAHPELPVIALIGDGAMSNQLSAIVTAVEHGVNVVWVVMNNSAFGTIAGLQESHYGTDYGCVFVDPAGEPYSPDFATIAIGCGATGLRVESAGELVPALRQALAATGPVLIDVPMVNDPVPTPGHWNINDIYKGAF